MVTAYGIWYLNVIDSRKEELLNYVKSIISDEQIMLLSLNGDASFRRYFRVSGKNLIAVDAPPSTQKNKEFISIDKALEAVSVKVPKIIAYDLDKGFMLLEDLGDTTFAKVAIGAQQQSYYEKAVDLLPKIATVDVDCPLFDREFINFELSLFDTWMLDKKLKVTLSDEEKETLKKNYSYLADNCLSQEQVAVHRDYHSRNLMKSKDELAVIDFQDMVKGPITYDLASIIYDCYINLDKDLISHLIQRAFNNYRNSGFLSETSLEEFKAKLKLTSLQRHVKVLGIFCRLSLRDGKDNYLNDLPRVICYVLEESKDDPKLQSFRAIIEKYVVGKF